MSILFRKISPYLVPRTLEGIHRLLLGIDNPPSLSSTPLLIEGALFASPLLRSTTCAISSSTTLLSELSEIRLNITKLLSPDEQQTISSTLVRRAFLRGWDTDTLEVSRATLLTETLHIFSLIESFPSPTLLTIQSHTFRLKIIQGYLLFGEIFFQDPSLIHLIANEETKMFEFDEAFTKESLPSHEELYTIRNW